MPGVPGWPGSGQEERIALQRQAQDSAERAAELARNIVELGKIAGGQPAAEGSASSGVPLPAPDVPEHGRLIDLMRDHPLTPIGAATLVTLLVLMSLWRTRVRKAGTVSDMAPAALPPLPVQVDLELPQYDTPLPDDEPAAVRTSAAASGSANTSTAHSAQAPTGAASSSTPRPVSGLPFAGLSLDLSDSQPTQNGPYPFDHAPGDVALTVRFELAQALWEAGQPHTARALAEDVAEQATGSLQQQARAWLADRA